VNHKLFKMLFLSTAATTCTAEEFQCSDGACIKREFRCDGVPNDCPDNSDETLCGTCIKFLHHLPVNNSQIVISRSFKSSWIQMKKMQDKCEGNFVCS
jgi:hypothetical protein